MDDRREIEKSSTWPPTTAMVGRDSQRVGKSLPPPWSPRAVQARWMRFINPIRPSMDAIIFFLLSQIHLFSSMGGVVPLRCVEKRRRRSQGRLTGRRRRFEETESRLGRKKTPLRRKLRTTTTSGTHKTTRRRFEFSTGRGKAGPNFVRSAGPRC